MSFWGRIGLADKKMLSELQSELTLLREENQRITKQNEELCQAVTAENELLKAISERQLQSAKVAEEINGLHTELEEISETMENLWKIMKVSFVDSVLTELDKSV